MKIKLIAFLLLACLVFSSSVAQTRRGMTPADTLRVAEVSDAQISPNGALVAYVVTTNEGNERRSALWLARAAAIVAVDALGAGLGKFGPTIIPLPAGLNGSRPRWSPDGRRLAFYGTRERQTGIWLVSPVERGTPRFVAAVHETNFFIPYAGETFAWSPDGRRIAFVSATEDERVDAPASTSSGISSGSASTSNDKRDDPHIIDRIQYKSRTSFSDRLRTHIWLADLDDSSTPPRQLTSGSYNDHALTWSPRGDEIAFLSNREPDPDARNNSDIYVVGTSDARTRRLTETQGCEYEPQWSPDGRFIAYTATTRDVTTIDSVSEDAHVWIADSANGTRREISGSLDRRARAPHWSPDGATVLFLANDRGRTNLYAASVENSQVTEVLGSIIRPGDKCRGLAAPPVLPPFQITGFSISATRGSSLFALTVTDPTHPAEVWLFRPSACFNLARLSEHNDTLTHSFALVQPETFTFKSFDGTPVQAWLMKPVSFRVASSTRYPLVLTIHGGPHGMYGDNFDAVFQAYAARGYAVLFINPRGSNGYGQKFSDGTFREWGGGDYRDLMAGVDEALNKYSWLDGERMGVTGASYGGFMTNWMITQTPRFRAAVARASVSNLISFYATSLYQDLIHAEFGSQPSDDYELLWRWSPLRYVRDAHTPTLFIHGEQDNDVHITQAEEMYTALRWRGVEAVLARYPREGHSFHEPLHRQDALERTIAWFDNHLK